MLTLTETRVIARQVLKQLDVAGEADAGVRAFDQIVTEQGLGRKTGFENRGESLNVVNRFAMKDGFAEQVLLRVGNRPAVGIGSRGVRKHPRESGGGRARQRDAHAWLNDAEPATSNSLDGIDFDLVQRMRYGFDQAPGRARRQLRVCVQGDDVANRTRYPANDQDVVRSAAG